MLLDTFVRIVWAVCLVLCLIAVWLAAVWARSWLLDVGIDCEDYGCGFAQFGGLGLVI